MEPGETLWLALRASVGADAVLLMYFHWRARRNAFLVLATKDGALPLLATWAWAVPFYAIMIVIFASPSSPRWATFDLPGWVRVCGALVILPTPFLCLWVLGSLADNFTGAFTAVLDQKLVRRGPYRRVRHPLYALECAFLVSIALATASWIVLGFACAGILTIRLVVIPHEEAYMLERFGRTYRQYRKKTGLLFPNLRP